MNLLFYSSAVSFRCFNDTLDHRSSPTCARMPYKSSVMVIRRRKTLLVTYHSNRLNFDLYHSLLARTGFKNRITNNDGLPKADLAILHQRTTKYNSSSSESGRVAETNTDNISGQQPQQASIHRPTSNRSNREQRRTIEPGE